MGVSEENGRGGDGDDPALASKNTPQHFETGSAAPEFMLLRKTTSRGITFEALDELDPAISGKFDQPGYRTYSSLQTLNLKATRNENFSEELKTVDTLQLYGSDLHAANLRSCITGNSEQQFSSSSGDMVKVKNSLLLKVI